MWSHLRPFVSASLGSLNIKACVEFMILDMYFVWIDANDWAVFIMQLADLVCVLDVL
jgi:hypothetical protein